jgi:chemotaxis protein MotB
MRQRRALLSSEGDGTADLWPSYADILSTFSLILFILVLLAYVRNLLSGSELAAYQERIAAAERQLAGLEGQLQVTTLEIRTGRERLAQSDLSLQAQRDLLQVQSRELAALRAKLSGIALLSVEVVRKVKQSIEWELGTLSSLGAPLVLIGDNGNIVLNESLVFEFNSFAIKPEAGKLLDTLSTALGNVLADPTVADNVDVIAIQGHTDERGSSAFNRDLSAKRANAVLNHLFAANPDLERRYGRYFTSSAYSEFRPLNTAADETAYEQNRRIEISVGLRDNNARRVIEQYMQSAQDALPAGASHGAAADAGAPVVPSSVP